MQLERKLVPSAWPIFVALAVVVALAAANVIIDLAVDAETEALTLDIVNNSLQSVALVDDLRAQAQKLAAPATGEELAAIREHIAKDARSYEPLATYPGERAEWEHLRLLLDQLDQPDGDKVAARRTIDQSIDRLVRLNQAEAANKIAAIRHTQHRSFLVDIVSGLIVFGVAGLVTIVLVRLLRSRRRLVEKQFELTLDRQRDLEGFAGRVAHELRRPLTSLRLSADLLAANHASTQSVSQRIARNVDDMAALIDNLLMLSTSGQPQLGSTPVSPVISEVLEQTEPALHGSHVAVSVQDCMVACPPTVLRQIVSNLVTNAAKYRSPERELEVSIAVTCERGFAELTVADNGVGMDAEAASHIFEPFYRADATRDVPGHGLGLAIVGRTVDALHGTYTVKSARGQGSQFSIRLPLAAEISGGAIT
jgi:signal transduction histidine kinase